MKKISTIFFKSLVFFMFFSISVLIGSEVDYNVKDFGAVNDGITLTTPSIQKAIDIAAQNGGGIVLIPAGKYKVGTIILKDNITLHLENGAEIIGSSNIEDYIQVHQKMESRTKGLYAKYFLIFAEDAKNISITGKGTINGNGLKNFQITRPQNMRPYLMRLVNCKNVTIKDVKLRESANWTLHLLGCRDVIIEGVKLYNSTHNGNRDGIDIDACDNVMISDCRVWSVDDAIVMKASTDRICKNITITNCVLSSYASGVKTGTESNGGFKNITVSNCVIENIPVHAGIELMTVDGGDMENIVFSNIVMNNVATPIFVYLGNRARPYKKGQYVQKVADVKDIYFDNIVVNGAKLPSGVVGLSYKMIRNISFNNISVRYAETVKEEPLAVNAVPNKDFSYPMAKMFGVKLPAYAFYCRNAEALQFNNINIYAAAGEKRPAFVFDNINDITLNSIKSNTNNPNLSTAYFRNSKNIYAIFCRADENSVSLFELEKNNCQNIHLINNFPLKGQNEINKMGSIKIEPPFAEISTDEKYSYSVTGGEFVDGLYAMDISKKSLTFELEMPEKGTPQIILLVKGIKGKKQKVRLKYDDTTQEFTVVWNTWGWAPISLSQSVAGRKKISFEIEAVESDSKLLISKVYLKKLKLGYTD